MKLDFENIQEDFEVYGIQVDCTEEIKEKCLRLCETHSLTGEQIAVSWLGFAASNSYEAVTLESLENFEKELLKQKKLCVKDKQSALNDVFLTSTKKVLSTVDDDLLAAYGAPATIKNADSVDSPQRATAQSNLAFSQSLEELKSSPLAPSLTQSKPSQQSQRYSQRTNSGAVVGSYGTRVETTKWKADFSYIPEVKELSCGSERPLNAPYNFMFEKLRDSAEVLDYTISFLGDQIVRSSKIEETTHLQSASNELVWCVGRICCDSVGRLNAASVMLESDRESCSGSIVRLDLSKMQKYSLFPGQVVAVKGINTMGKCLVAEEIIIGNTLPLADSSLSLEKEGIQLRIACGPFTTLENLMYEPLMDLLEDVVANPPHILFLLGPMLDISHPCLEDPMLSDTYDSILARCIDKIDATLKDTATKVYLVTSLRDICCTPIYPTPPVFISGLMNMDSNIKLLPDPSLLDIDGVTIGLTTIDYPMHISKEEIGFFPRGSDRLARLSQHMLLQQSFYPVYPPPEDICLNIEEADLHTRLPFTPHVMITPSDLKGYIKNVDGCLFINPERLTKGKIGGCYCKLEIRPSQQKNSLEINAHVLKI